MHQKLLHAVAQWRWPKALAVGCGFAMALGFAGGLGYALQADAQKATWEIALAYGALFSMINIPCVLLYATVMAWAARIWGMFGVLPVLTFAEAWRLALLTGMVPLAVILLFGKLLELPFSLAMLLLILHVLWLRTLEFPADWRAPS